MASYERTSSEIQGTGVHAFALVESLYDFIVPLMEKSKGKEYYTHNSFSPKHEAGKFVAALQNFILATASSTAANGFNGAIEVSLQDSDQLSVEEGPLILEHSVPTTYNPESGPLEPEDQKSEHSQASAGEIFIMPPSAPASVIDDMYIETTTALEKALKALQQHVFNRMPIRLLEFKSEDSTLKIILLDKSEIFERLATKLRSQFYDGQFMPSAMMQKDGDIQTVLDSQPFSIKNWAAKHANYAILSHTWIHAAPGEVTYDDWIKGTLEIGKPGYDKLVNFCKVAERDHRVTLGWMDTICINKESSSELDESIRSMYKWYCDASICITYLAHTSTLSDMLYDPWFTRGWTLQELLAPSKIKFYSMGWEKLVSDDNDKESLPIISQISAATTITSDEIMTFTNDSSIPHSRKMQWAANRQVTREEDTAYSLMGIFNISISIAYGEGAERAFFRLLKKILASSKNVSDIFNWAGDLPMIGDRNLPSLLPSSPQHYLRRSTFVQAGRSSEPATLTHLGLRIQVLLVPAIERSWDAQTPASGPVGDYSASVAVSCSNIAWREYSKTYTLLNKQAFLNPGPKQSVRKRMTFGILNFLEYPMGIRLQPASLAIALQCYEEPGKVTPNGKSIKIHTDSPIVIKFVSKKDRHLVKPIYKDQLAKHGMQLVTMYL